MAHAGRTAPEILARSLERATAHLGSSLIRDEAVAEPINLVARNVNNRACVRVLLACGLAKASSPDVDIRKPYTEIGDADVFSGRSYDETYISPFVTAHRLPCNPTTAFLTPALRNRNVILTPDLNLVGRPAGVYAAMLELLDDVYRGRLTADDLLAETIRVLLNVRNERQQRMESLLLALRSSAGETSLSSEEIVTLIAQHLALKGASRLPVLIVAAAYRAAENHLGERIVPLLAHTAADRQTGSLGDLEIALVGDDRIVTGYEMKNRRVTVGDIDVAVSKLVEAGSRIDNYIFITTEPIESAVQEYARGIYGKTGIEFVVLDCLSFLRHFLHLFHRLRVQFLESYQEHLLREPDSAVSAELKEAFLAMRHAAEGAA